MTETVNRWLPRVTGVVVIVALIFAFTSPREVTLGQSARLFFIHVPSIMVAYLAFTATLIASALFLAKKQMKWDHLALAAAEAGAVFTGMTLVIGMIWAKPTWGVYWTWSARLTLTAILFFVYLGYLALRRAITDPEVRAKRAAILGILSVVQIPIVHMSVIWWRDVHQPPTLARPGEMQIDPPIFIAFLVAAVAFVLLATLLISLRYRIAQAEYILETADPTTGVAGDAVTAPVLTREV